MTKAQLFHLPNELFLYIFQHIKSTDLVQAFNEIDSDRIQNLIQSFITHVDISQETNQWIENYLLTLFRQENLIAIRLQDKHIQLILKYLLLTNIQTMHILSSDWTTEILKEGIDKLGQCLKELSITFTYPHGKGDIASHLFQSDSQIEQLTINGRFLYFDAHEINTCTLLTYLSIELEGMQRVFVLMKHLPNLEELKVKFRTEDRMVHPTFSTESPLLNSKLHRVTFTGCTKYFDHFEIFFALFGSSIEYLLINIDLMYHIIDGKRLERELLNKMPCLSSFDFIFHSIATYSEPIAIETFQTVLWQKFNPIVYCHDIHAHEHTIFTLPYKSDRFKHLSNDYVLSCISNRSVPICFERVRTLSLIPTTPLNFETFQFIKNSFPNLHTLELTNPIKYPELEHEHNNEFNRNISSINKDFLLNSNLQFLTIKKFSFLLRNEYDDYEIFRRFLYLLPNLTYLQMYIGRALYRQILIHEYEENYIKKLLNNIKLLQMVRFYDEKNVLSNEEIHSLFPNAQILFDYDEI